MLAQCRDKKIFAVLPEHALILLLHLQRTDFLIKMCLFSPFGSLWEKVNFLIARFNWNVAIVNLKSFNCIIKKQIYWGVISFHRLTTYRRLQFHCISLVQAARLHLVSFRVVFISLMPMKKSCVSCVENIQSIQLITGLLNKLKKKNVRNKKKSLTAYEIYENARLAE